MVGRELQMSTAIEGLKGSRQVGGSVGCDGGMQLLHLWEPCRSRSRHLVSAEIWSTWYRRSRHSSLVSGRLASVILRGRWHRRWAGSAARGRRVEEPTLLFPACPLEVAASNDALVEPGRHPPTEPDDPRSPHPTRSGWQSRQDLPLAMTRSRLLCLYRLGGLPDAALEDPGACYRRGGRVPGVRRTRNSRPLPCRLLPIRGLSPRDGKGPVAAGACPSGRVAL